MLALLIVAACAPDSATATASPSVDPQLGADFVDQLTQGHACTDSQLGPLDDVGALGNEAGTVRLVIDAVADTPESRVLVSTGVDLGAVWDDEDACDDIVPGLATQVTRMVWSLAAGEVFVTNQAGTRTFELVDIVLTPDPAYAFDDDFLDAADFDPVDVGSVVIGPIPHGGLHGPLP